MITADVARTMMPSAPPVDSYLKLIDVMIREAVGKNQLFIDITERLLPDIEIWAGAPTSQSLAGRVARELHLVGYKVEYVVLTTRGTPMNWGHVMRVDWVVPKNNF